MVNSNKDQMRVSGIEPPLVITSKKRLHLSVLDQINTVHMEEIWKQNSLHFANTSTNMKRDFY